VLIVVFAFLLLWWLIKTLIQAPHALLDRLGGRRERRGYQALSQGLIATMSGDVRTAQRLAKQSQTLLRTSAEPLLPLLAAETKRLELDYQGAVSIFQSMCDNPQTRLIGLKGLYREAMRDANFWAATMGFVTCGYSLYLVVMHLPRFAVDLGADLATGGQALGLAAGASAVSMWACGQLAGRVGKKKLLLALYVIRALSLVLLASASDVWHLYAFALIYGVASMPIIPLKTGLIGELYGANALGSILGMVWFLHQVLAALAVFLGGWLRVATGSYALAFWSAAALLVVGAFATSLVREARRQA